MTITASQAILKGLSSDGGLFVTTGIPKLDTDEIAPHLLITSARKNNVKNSCFLS